MPQDRKLSPEEEALILRGLLEPKPRTTTLKGIETPLPPSPYPFKNPITMTPAIDASVKDLRTNYAPGAGTESASGKPITIDSIPPLGHLSQRMKDAEFNDIMKNRASGNMTSLAGLSSADKGRIYINPMYPQEIQDKTLAHELGHTTNKLGHEYGAGTPERPYGTQALEDLYSKSRNLINKFIPRR